MRVLHLAPGSSRPSGIQSYASGFRESLRCSGVDVEARDASQLRAADVEDFDLVHAELGGGCQPEFWVASEVARTQARPLVLTLHDPPRVVWRPFEVPGRSRSASVLSAAAAHRRSRRAERALAGGASALFVLSEKALPGVRAALAPPEDATVTVLPFPAHASGRGLLRDAAAAGRDFTVGFHGYWYRSKGIEFLLDAVAQTRGDGRPVRVRLWGEPLPGMGDQADRYREYVLARIARLGLEDQVTCEGHIPDHVLHERLREVDAVVLPYRRPSHAYNGLTSSSSALADALAAGVPVVATDVRGLRGQVRDGVDGLLIAPEDSEALADALRRLRDDGALRERIGAGLAARGVAAPGEIAAGVYRAALARAHAT
jgi:glycosyltransferase involved in cell wall biosynthesis